MCECVSGKRWIVHFNVSISLPKKKEHSRIKVNKNAYLVVSLAMCKHIQTFPCVGSTENEKNNN